MRLDMLSSLNSCLRQFVSTRSISRILLYGFIIRLAALLYSIFHDRYVNHIKYTDIDYHVFTNGSRAILNGTSPFKDTEYRYSPIVALVFVPNIVLNDNSGKLLLIIADILGGYLHYILNIYQGTPRLNSKLFLSLWLFNPITIAISTRGSFEPIITLLVLASVYLLITYNFFTAGLLYGLSIHLKLYPIIYALPFFTYMIQRKPYLRTQTKLSYWIKTLSPNSSHMKFFISSGISLLLSSYVSYRFYGRDYLEQSFLYHMRRKDLQHNFSAYFYLFRLFPGYQDLLSIIAFASQFLGVMAMALLNLSLDMNRRVKLRKLSFSLFSTTFLFVSLNKVCTSQYFNWYLIFLPLILDCIKTEISQTYRLILAWFSTQAVWLLFAYLYEYQGLAVLDYVGMSSIVFLISNLWILRALCYNFDASTVWQTKFNEVID